MGAGNVRDTKDGGKVAPLSVRIVYDRQGGLETREAKVACQVSASGSVIGVGMN